LRRGKKMMTANSNTFKNLTRKTALKKKNMPSIHWNRQNTPLILWDYPFKPNDNSHYCFQPRKCAPGALSFLWAILTRFCVVQYKGFSNDIR
jgi:hypothetical protein